MPNKFIKLMKGKALRKHSLHEKTAASVLLKPFISSNERCHTTIKFHCCIISKFTLLCPIRASVMRAAFSRAEQARGLGSMFTVSGNTRNWYLQHGTLQYSNIYLIQSSLVYPEFNYPVTPAIWIRFLANKKNST